MNLIIKYRERQVQDMKHGIGVLKKRDKRRFVIEAFVKRLDWTLWAFKYYNYHKYQICIRFQRKQKKDLRKWLISILFLDFTFSGIGVQEC